MVSLPCGVADGQLVVDFGLHDRVFVELVLVGLLLFEVELEPDDLVELALVPLVLGRRD